MKIIMICKRKTTRAANSASNSPFSLSTTATLKAPRSPVFPAWVKNKVLYSCKDVPVAAAKPATPFTVCWEKLSPSRC